MTLVVNLFAGPGSGKSTTATGVFSMLKMHGVNCEYVSEYAKDLAWENTLTVYYNQIAILGEQHRRQHRLLGKCDIMITDSPILQQCAYVDDPWYKEVCTKLFDEFENMNFYINRVKPFSTHGRKEGSINEAKKIDEKIKLLLKDRDHMDFDGNFHAINIISSIVLSKLNKKMKLRIDDGSSKMPTM